MSAPAVRRLGDLRKADAAEVGGKAAQLGELIAAGARVPDGVVLTVAAGGMSTDERGSLLLAGVADLGSGPFAVRSSGIAEDGAERSFAGMYETVLDVSADGLPAAADRVLASAHASRAKAYGTAANGHMAVIVQRMVAAGAGRDQLAELGRLAADLVGIGLAQVTQAADGGSTHRSFLSLIAKIAARTIQSTSSATSSTDSPR